MTELFAFFDRLSIWVLVIFLVSVVVILATLKAGLNKNNYWRNT